jgi:hypothetical protein
LVQSTGSGGNSACSAATGRVRSQGVRSNSSRPLHIRSAVNAPDTPGAQVLLWKGRAPGGERTSLPEEGDAAEKSGAVAQFASEMDNAGAIKFFEDLEPRALLFLAPQLIGSSHSHGKSMHERD